MPLVELPCVLALLFLWCWTCVEVAVRAGRGPYWGALGLFCNPLVILLFALPGANAELELPPSSTRLRAACWLSLLQLVLLAAVAGWALNRT